MERYFYFSLEGGRLQVIETSEEAAYSAGGAAACCWFLQYLYNLSH